MSQPSRQIRHGETMLALHAQRDGAGPPLLLLHALGSSHTEWHPVPEWAGPVWALDFAGHGAADWRAGGAYTPELCAADADAALAEIGSTTPVVVVGRGLGAYAALLLAGGRPREVAAAVLLPGEGLAGGGEVPRFDDIDSGWARLAARLRGALEVPPGVDPRARAVAEDARPSDYAASFAAAATRVILVEDEGSPRPPWWCALRGLEGVGSAPDLVSALGLLACA